MTDLGSGFIVGLGGDLHLHNVWLDNVLNTHEPLDLVQLKEGGRAVFQNVEFSDGTCVKTSNSRAIDGNKRRIGQRGNNDYRQQGDDSR